VGSLVRGDRKRKNSLHLITICTEWHCGSGPANRRQWPARVGERAIAFSEVTTPTTKMSDEHVTLDETTYDVIVLGTSLIPAIVGSALSRVGKKVLHLSSAEQYGGNTCSVSLADWPTWAARHAHPTHTVTMAPATSETLAQWQGTGRWWQTSVVHVFMGVRSCG
jgi:hypothetical protein